MPYLEGVILKRITYKQLKEKSYDLLNDSLGIVSDYLEQTRDALLANPNNEDDSKSVLNMVIYNNTIVGRHMLMPTKIKNGKKTVIAQTGGGHEIHESFQGKGLGSLVVKDTIMNSEYPIYIGQLYSSVAISILRKMNICIFGKPLYFKQLKTRSVLAAKGYKGLSLSLASFWGDIFLKIKDFPNWIRTQKLKRKYVIRKETIIPEWVNPIILQDRHKYMEIHDKNWLQWNLNHVFSKNTCDKNFFFGIYDKTGNAIGFYMTKERFEENEKGTFKNIIRGTVVEWGSRNEKELNEADINLMALSTFSSEVDKINTVISSEGIEKKLKKMGYIYRGIYKMTFKPSLDCDEDMREQKNWRIRYGGCNTILV